MNPFEEFLRRLFMQRAGPLQSTQEKLTRAPDIGKAYEIVAQSPYYRDTLGIKSNVSAMLDDPSVYGSYTPDLSTINYNVGAPIFTSMPQGAYPADSYTARNVLTHEGGHEQQRLFPDNFPTWKAMTTPAFFANVPKNVGIKFEDLKKTKFSRADPDKFDPYGYDVVNIDMQNKTIDNPSRLFGIFQRFASRNKRNMTPAEVAAFEALSPYYMFAGRSSGNLERVIGTDEERFAQAFTNAADFLSRTSSDTKGYRELLGKYEGNTPGMGGIVADLLARNPIYSNHPLHNLIRSASAKEKKK